MILAQAVIATPIVMGITLAGGDPGFAEKSPPAGSGFGSDPHPDGLDTGQGGETPPPGRGDGRIWRGHF